MYPKKSLFIALCLLFTHLSLQAQFVTATEVENWKAESYPSADYNLNSAYVYLLNGHQLKYLFEGHGMTKSEKKEIGINKGDFPRYAYMALEMSNPSKPGEMLTYPMMIHDVRDQKNTRKVTEYGGRYLQNIPDETLKNQDLLAKVKFESIKGNDDKSFWKKAAKISLDLGKTATNLAQLTLTGNFLNVSQQMLPQIDQSLNSLEKAEESGKVSSEFYIKLMRKELSALYEEKVVAASLYKLHWDNDKPSKSRFFRNAKINKVDDFKTYVRNSKAVYILVVNTKSEYNMDHSEIAYTNAYIEKKSNDFRKIRNSTKRDIERKFLQTLKLAVELKRQIDIFEKSLNTNYPDWLAYSRITDLHYSIQNNKKIGTEILEEIDGLARSKYTNLYEQVLNDINIWHNTDLLNKSYEISNYIIKNQDKNTISSDRPEQIYEEIQLLNYLRERVAETESQGRIPKEIQELDVFEASSKILLQLEKALFDKAFKVNPRWSAEKKKQWLLQQITEVYPLCTWCADRVGEEITAIDNATYEENLSNFRKISAEYYAKIDCYEGLLTGLNQYIRYGIDSLQLSEMRIKALNKDKSELESYINEFSEISSKDYTKLNIAELDKLISRYYINREKLVVLIYRLKPILNEQAIPVCVSGQP